MSNPFQRRKFLASMIGIPAILSACSSSKTIPSPSPSIPQKSNGLKTSLNAFSFNAPLSDGSMTISDMLDFCATTGFEGVDITGYYFKGYPAVPPDEYLYHIKRKAFRLGIEITGTGVRNDFTIADKAKREQEVTLVKNWIEVAAKIGAPVIRIFAGNQKNEGISKEQVTDWMLKDIQTCVDYGKQYGVIIGLQNHNDFIKTAEQAINIIKKVNSDWFGLVLDTGSFVTLEPYSEIKKTAEFAVNWQVKERLTINGKAEAMDLEKLFRIINSSNYRGYLPIETLSAGDPFVIVPPFLKQVRAALDKAVNS